MTPLQQDSGDHRRLDAVAAEPGNEPSHFTNSSFGRFQGPGPRRADRPAGKSSIEQRYFDPFLVPTPPTSSSRFFVSQSPQRRAFAFRAAESAEPGLTLLSILFPLAVQSHDDSWHGWKLGAGHGFWRASLRSVGPPEFQSPLYISSVIPSPLASLGLLTSCPRRPQPFPPSPSLFSPPSLHLARFSMS